MTPNGNVQATVEGNVQGPIAIGDHNLQIGNVNGGVVNINVQVDQPSFLKRPVPINLRPRPFPALLNRNNESAAVKSALQLPVPVSLYGEPGIGKSCLLRQVSYLPETSKFPDGVIYLNVSERGLDDILQSIFDAFHESRVDFKPTDAEVRYAMQGIRALLILDDIDLSEDEVSRLLDVVPACAILLASAQRKLWGEGKVVSLQGLPDRQAFALFERELGLPVAVDYQADVREICTMLEGHPFRIIQVASLVREGNASISGIKSQLAKNVPDNAITRTAISNLTENQERLLAILAAAGGAAVPLRHLGVISRSRNMQRDLQRLTSLGLVQAHSPRYSLAGNLAESLEILWDLSSWDDALVNYFLEWLSQQPAQNLVEDSADLVVRVVKKAGEKRRWLDVIRLGRALEQFLVAWKRWQAWDDILQLILEAARALGDAGTEAWALHQLGTRAACLGYMDQGYSYLTNALNIRQAIGDREGLAVTQNNINIFFAPPPPPAPPRAGRTADWGSWLPYAGLGAVVVIALLVIAVVILSILPRLFVPAAPSATATSTPTLSQLITITQTPTFTLTPTPSVTPSPTSSLTATPTSTPSVTPSPTQLPGLGVTLYQSKSTDRVVLYQGPGQGTGGDYFQVPVLITVVNQNNLSVGAFDLIIYYRAFDGTHQANFKLDNKNPFQESVRIFLGSPGSVINFEAKVMVPRKYEGTTVELLPFASRCQADLSCQLNGRIHRLPEVVYDFVESAPLASWFGYDQEKDEEFSIEFQAGSDVPLGDAVVGYKNIPVLEDGSQPFLVLGTFPPWINESQLYGIFELSAVDFRAGDQLVVRVGFMNNASGDGVTFRVDCFPAAPSALDAPQMISFQTFQVPYGIDLSLYDRNDGLLKDRLVPLPEEVVRGDCPQFVLGIESGQTFLQDWAVWTAVYIERP